MKKTIFLIFNMWKLSIFIHRWRLNDSLKIFIEINDVKKYYTYFNIISHHILKYDIESQRYRYHWISKQYWCLIFCYGICVKQNRLRVVSYIRQIGALEVVSRTLYVTRKIKSVWIFLERSWDISLFFFSVQLNHSSSIGYKETIYTILLFLRKTKSSTVTHLLYMSFYTNA